MKIGEYSGDEVKVNKNYWPLFTEALRWGVSEGLQQQGVCTVSKSDMVLGVNMWICGPQETPL